MNAFIRPACALTFLLAGLAGGCAAREDIPMYPLASETETIDAVQARSAALQRLTGQGAVTLSNPARGSVRLDAAFVLAPPDRARVRAWKFNQAVLDLTVTDAGVWLYAPRESQTTTAPASNIGAGIREWLRYLNRVDIGTGSDMRSNEKTIMVFTPQDGGGTLTTTIDRPTRTVRSYRLVDASGTERFTLTLDHYRFFGPALWPSRITARSATGIIVVETGTLQPNVAAETAFTPPARAKRLP